MTHEDYMQRCIHLARLAGGYTGSNPMVGAVLVHGNRIIGEGYHQKYGEAHAEVNCINSVRDKDRKYISESTLYVSLEPCAHFGKTPPCTDLIIQHKIKNVVIGTKDVFSKVNGVGIERLQSVGANVMTGVLEESCINLNKRFFTFHQKKRPYIILKWAQTANGIIGSKSNERLLITNDATNTLVHKWRSEEACILVGTNTVLKDNPQLTNRLYSDKQPVRMFIDKNLSVPENFNLYNNAADTFIFNGKENKQQNRHTWIKLQNNFSAEEEILDYCHKNNLISILIEGGAKTLQSFIDKGLWDECRVITNTQLYDEDGITAPQLINAKFISSENILTDKIDYYRNKI